MSARSSKNPSVPRRVTLRSLVLASTARAQPFGPGRADQSPQIGNLAVRKLARLALGQPLDPDVRERHPDQAQHRMADRLAHARHLARPILGKANLDPGVLAG